MKRNIAIDARWVGQEISGIGEYTRELISSLLKLPGLETYYVIYSGSRVPEGSVTIGAAASGFQSDTLMPFTDGSSGTCMVSPEISGTFSATGMSGMGCGSGAVFGCTLTR